MNLELRPITDSDLEFLYQVYASTRSAEMALVDWDDTQKEAFLRFQFNAQHKYYQENYSQAQFSIVCHNGLPIGRLYLDRRETEIRIVDITLLPEQRGQGTGSRILGQVLAEGDQTGKRVSIHVERNNPALSLYERLGFRITADRGVYWFMEREPQSREEA